jgi:hypothetical protein
MALDQPLEIGPCGWRRRPLRGQALNLPLRRPERTWTRQKRILNRIRNSNLYPAATYARKPQKQKKSQFVEFRIFLRRIFARKK